MTNPNKNTKDQSRHGRDTSNGRIQNLLPRTKLPIREVLVGDALTRLRDLPSGSIDTMVTSPPYFMLRNYGAEGQIGLEGSVDCRSWSRESHCGRIRTMRAAQGIRSPKRNRATRRT